MGWSDCFSHPDPYKILGVAKDAKLSEIRSDADRVEDASLRRVEYNPPSNLFDHELEE